jgi:hypothetical protein
MKYIKLQHQVVEARWVAEESKWHVKVCGFGIGSENHAQTLDTDKESQNGSHHFGLL